jgi:YD repeat-containing protein
VWETTYTYYDALNRAVMTVTPTGSYTSPQGYVTTTVYNAFGQVSSTTQYAQAISTSSVTTGTPPGLPAAATPGSGADRVTSYTYDAIGRVSSETDTGGYASSAGYGSANVGISYTYNGENQVLTKTVNGATTTTAYDALGRVLTVTAPARQALVSNWQSILESTPADDLTTAALYTSVSPVTAYVYDALGHAVSTTVTGGGLTQQSTATYNALGQLTQRVDAGGNVHTTTYGANGNVLTQSYSLGGNTVTTTNTYDANNQLLSTSVQRSNASTYDSYIQQKYNAFGEVIAKGDNNGYEASYTYNAIGQQTSAPDSHGATHLYGYDLVGNLVVDRSTVTGGASAVWTHNVLNLANQVVTQITPATSAATGEGGTPVTTSYDRWGNVIAKTDANGNVTTYQYDSQNHLIEQTQANVLVVSATGVYTWVNPTQTWAYNVNGQLTQSTDANGNVTTYSYDAAGNQTAVKDGAGATTTTAYDALGRAVATQTPQVQTATTLQSIITFTS